MYIIKDGNCFFSLNTNCVDICTALVKTEKTLVNIKLFSYVHCTEKRMTTGKEKLLLTMVRTLK